MLWREGPVHVQSVDNPQPIAGAMMDAARSLGMPVFDSPNGRIDDLRLAFTNIALYWELGNSSVFHRLVKGELLPGNLSPQAMKICVYNSAVIYRH